MGMYDEIATRFPLPTRFAHLQNNIFQTKDLDRTLTTYLITEDGNLEYLWGGLVENPPKKILFYDQHGEFVAKFKKGKCLWIRSFPE